jgi:cytochrome c553
LENVCSAWLPSRNKLHGCDFVTKNAVRRAKLSRFETWCSAIIVESKLKPNLRLSSFLTAANIRCLLKPMRTGIRTIQTFDPHRIALGTLLLLVGGMNLSGCRLGNTDAATRGREVFETCVPCHNPDGSGNSVVGAPNIAGMKAWYVERELDKFRGGVRGLQFNDVEGMRMGPMAISLVSEEDVKSVAHYVETLPPVRHAASLPGDPKAGEALYATCAACHGDNGAGNQDLGAPRIAGVDDWYLAAELRKFRSGVRGTNAKDREGRLMRPMARTLADEDAIRNVVAYVGTLKP